MCDTYVRHLPLTDNVFHVSGDGQRFRIAISPQQGLWIRFLPKLCPIAQNKTV
jgi:hypothetical protein